MRALSAAVKACAAIEALVLCALSTALSVGSVVHILTCCVEGVVEGFHCAVDTSDISVFMCCFKVFEGLLDRGFLVGRYLVARYLGVTEETVLLLLLDNNHRLMECIRVHEGSVNSSSITMRRLVELALFKRASFAVLAHNHPDGIAIPSSDDIFTTRQAKRAFDLLEIHLMGHIIVAGDTFTNILDVHS